MNLIAAADRNWAIGYQGRLLVSIPADHKMFRETTTGKVVILGRKTLDTFPGGLPLPNRTNIILSKNTEFRAKDAVVVGSLEELLSVTKQYNSEDLYVIGGESIYRLLLPYCDTAIITKIDYAYSADAYLPDLSKSPEWTMTGESEEMTCFDIEYTFQRWERMKG
ncbi:MAG: dihydrofolate reductase [Lachnospiraceae bacterium]|nr:dihydrofolate reductase [Lachnospiraceae bacterium]